MGHSSGMTPHLHYEIHINNEPINPMRENGRLINPQDLLIPPIPLKSVEVVAPSPVVKSNLHFEVKPIDVNSITILIK